jgi:hypothetical protein
LKEAVKKARERAHLHRFKEIFAHFPEGTITSHEHPDFLVETSGGCIGIEHTAFVRDSIGDKGSPLRAREHTEDKLLWLASREYDSRGLPPVMVHVHWNHYSGPGLTRMRGLAVFLADFVASHLPEQGLQVTVRDPHPAWESLPQEVDSLSIYRRESISRNVWTPVRADFVPTLSCAELQRIISGKEAKVSSYRQECQEVWLLIVAHGFEPSTHVDLGPEVEGHDFEAGFDRVFFLHHANEYVVELGVRPAF